MHSVPPLINTLAAFNRNIDADGIVSSRVPIDFSNKLLAARLHTSVKITGVRASHLQGESELRYTIN